jgi:hypothetical protein
METILIQGTSRKKSKLLIRLSKELGFKCKRIEVEELEDLFLKKSIDRGIKSGHANKAKVLKVLRK